MSILNLGPDKAYQYLQSKRISYRPPYEAVVMTDKPKIKAMIEYFLHNPSAIEELSTKLKTTTGFNFLREAYQLYLEKTR